MNRTTKLEDAFVKVSFDDDKTATRAREGDSELFSEWIDKGERRALQVLQSSHVLAP